MNNRKTAIITIAILSLLTAGIISYVNYLINQPLDIDLPKEFTYNGTKIALAWTDDNTGENLIIQSDRKEYSGFNSVDVYFSITNITRRDQDADIVIWLPSEKAKAEKMERINEDGSNFEFPILNFEINSNFEFSNRKDVGGNNNGYAANDKIESGETNYYKATIKYPPMSKGEFFIEAFGKKEAPRLLYSSLGAYGHLDPWYSSNWTYRKRIDIEADQVLANETDFPILATTTDSDLAFTGSGGKVASSTGADIVFADNAGNLLNYEREYYASTTGEIVYWIKTDISSTTDTVLYMYYGNSSMSTDLATTTGVWDDNYVMVQHLAHDGTATTTYPDFLDSTQYDNDGSSKNMNSDDLVDGQVDGSLDFDGTDDYTRITNSASVNPLYISVSAWIKNLGNASVNQIVSKDHYIGGDIQRVWQFRKDSNDKLQFIVFKTDADYDNAAVSTTDIADGSLHYVIGTWDGAYIKLYVDGELDMTPVVYSGSLQQGQTNDVLIGADEDISGAPTKFFNGLIDEVRISNTARTAGWIETEYNNQVSVNTFLTFGAEEDETPTEFISTIMQSGGDYSSLFDWEDAVECDLTATTTRVYSGSITGTLDENDTVTLYRGGVSLNATSTVVATTSDQILVDGIYGVNYDLTAQSGDVWRKDGSNYWTVSGTGAELGDTAIAVAQIDGAWTNPDTTAVVINDWTTSATNYIRIYTTTAARHEGVWDTGKYRLDVAGTAIDINEGYVEIQGLQIEADSYGIHTASSFTGWLKIGYCVMSGGDTPLAGIRIEFATGVPDVYLWNSVIYNWGQYGGYIPCINTNSYVYNNIVYNCPYGIWAFTGTIYAKNNACFNNTPNGDFVQTIGTWHASSANNCSSDDTADDFGTGGIVNKNASDNFTNLTSGSEDFHLKTNTTDLKNAGTNLFGDSNLSFSDDIDGDTRPASNWDIGADEAETAVEFVSTIMQTGGEYSRLYDWEDATDCDLTASSTRVYSITATTSIIADAAAVTTDSGASTATLVHQASTSQILLTNISGSFDSGDYVTDGTNSVVLSNNGAPAIAVAKIDGAWTSADETAVEIDDWTTSATNYIKIYTTETARHDGKWDTGKYRIELSGSSLTAITVNEDYVRIEGLQISVDDGWNDLKGIYIANQNTNNEITINGTIIKCITATYGNLKGIQISGNAIVKISNCVIYDFYTSGGGLYSWGILIGDGNTVFIYNCTLYNVKYGIYNGWDGGSNASITAKNVIVNGTSNGFKGTFDSASDYNISDISGDAPNDTFGGGYATVNFVSEAGDDFHLAGSDTAAKDAGTDLSADSNLAFSDDIDGEERPAGVSWDIGADEKKRATVVNAPHTNKWTGGLVGYWSFNGEDMDWASTTAEALDRSGNSNNGDVVNGAKAAIGKVGQGMEFDGSDDNILIGDPTSLQITGAITVSAWINPDANELSRFVSKRGSAPQRGYNIETNAGTSNPTVVFSISSDGSDVVASGVSEEITIGAMYHVVGVYNPSTAVQIYVNGVLSNENTTSIPASQYNPTTDVRIGSTGSSGSITNFDGILDEVRIYNRVLSVDEIAEQYRAGARKLQANSPITNKLTSGLVGHWTFNGEDMDWASTTAEALDRSGNSNNGNVINGAKAAIGKVGQGMEFDGDDDYVEISDFLYGPNLSISFWFNDDDNSGSAYEYMFSHGGWEVSNSINVVFIEASTSGQPNGALRTSVLDSNDTASGYFDVAAGLVDGKWHYYTLTVGSAGSRVYIDGVFNNSIAKGGDAINPTPSINIGARSSDHDADRFYGGLIDEVRIYNRALSTSEIGELYRAGARKFLQTN